MLRPDTTTFDVSSSSAVISLDPEYRGELVYPSHRRDVTPWGWFPGFVPAVAFSIFFSTASVFADPRTAFFIDSSTILGPQRPVRQRISLAEARRRALHAVWLCEQRRLEFAQLEGREFEALYGWEPR